MTINSKTREIWAEKTFELTNIAAGALIFGQFLSDRRFSFLSAIVGFIFILIGYIASLVLIQKK